MKFKVFDNAKKLQRYLKNTGESNHIEYWEMEFGKDTILLSIIRDENGTRIDDCTCKACTINKSRGIFHNICSYKAALIYRKSK